MYENKAMEHDVAVGKAMWLGFEHEGKIEAGKDYVRLM